MYTFVLVLYFAVFLPSSKLFLCKVYLDIKKVIFVGSDAHFFLLMIDKSVVNVNALAFLSTFEGTSNKRNVWQSFSNIQFILVHNFNVGQIKTTHTAGLQQVFLMFIIISSFEKIY